MPPENRRRRKRPVTDRSSWSDEDRRLHELKVKLDTPVAEMKLSVRIVNILEEYDVILARDILRQSYEDMMRMENFGDKTFREVKAAIAALGLIPPLWAKPKVDKTRVQTRPKSGGAQGAIDMW